MRRSTLGLWKALALVDPWGEQRDDVRAGIVARAVADGLYKRADGAPHKVKDFMPVFWHTDEDQAAAAQDADKRLSAKIRAGLMAVVPKRKSR